MILFNDFIVFHPHTYCTTLIPFFLSKVVFFKLRINLCQIYPFMLIVISSCIAVLKHGAVHQRDLLNSDDEQ